jgi:hypothetical protein
MKFYCVPCGHPVELRDYYKEKVLKNGAILVKGTHENHSVYKIVNNRTLYGVR